MSNMMRKVTVLGELVRHHINEEEKEMFEKMKNADVDLEELAQKVVERKQELEGESVSSGIKEIWKELKEFKMA